ncbi:hypothetical protein M409DRAFT_30399 [Zasmidium cellare ATCC 36951]|uniref:Guanine nucleotide-binding protein-like 3 N-terminal domain-containing protein n=1 Tax=Zasmidium cellare ATCC 36951 TaxID=1080233 RepID=A0A6A6BYH4_ZASCE|nr:uncharacterized protein M409DRAFT_30399 [Zasmidium cellare ATCC 36951]KAF2159118.1 hypothetical protein M409DRAFT_30399 [Zasmidium cellare ATCC 36951]
MKVGKPKSKRVPVRLRHKIEKASAAKQRKQRKEAKKNPQWQSRLKKDPGIPNLFPYKDRVLAEIEESKRAKAEEQERRREVARAQREGKKVGVEGGDEELRDPEEEMGDVDEEVDGEGEEVDGDEMEEDTNPMAALVASAQARAQTYRPNNTNDDEDEEEDEEDPESDVEPNLTTLQPKNPKPTSSEPTKNPLPKQALTDPLKPLTNLITRLEKTPSGIQQLLDYYQLPPLVTAGSDTATRLLVDVARKKGRLGRRGVPNLNAAALTVLGDLNEGRLELPALQEVQVVSKASVKAGNKSEVQIVSQLAEPFRIEGLFGDEGKTGAEMEVEDA